MPAIRYLYGPTTAAFAAEALQPEIDAGACVPFGPCPGSGLCGSLAGASGLCGPLAGASGLCGPLAGASGLCWASLNAGHFPPAFDPFRVEWERAAWDHAGDPAAETHAKRALLRWRLHTLLATVTGELSHHYEAVLARPDLPTSRALLGAALGRARQPAAAVEHLRQASEANPFDRAAARDLFQALTDAGDRESGRRLADERRLLLAAAPGLVAVDNWFAPAPPTRPLTLKVLSVDDFHRRFGTLDTDRALSGYTNAADTHAVLTLLADARPRRILEIGTALGHMTANLTEWSPDDAVVVSLGIVAGMSAGGPAEQQPEVPDRAAFGQFAGHFGKNHKVLFVTADSLGYDFSRIGPFDFAFLDGAHDLEHVLSDTLKVYRALSPGGVLVWHDFDSPVSWVQVRQALEQAALPETITHVAGTQVAFLHKQRTPSVNGSSAVHRQSAIGNPPSAICNLQSAIPKVAVVWEGSQGSLHSLALVNRELCLRLARRGHDLSLVPLELPDPLGVPSLPLPAALASRLHRSLGRAADVHVRHAWPPDFRPPAAGRWVVVQPWEFGSLPRAWLPPLLNDADEVWAYTHHVRDCYVQSGVPADRVHVVPLGVDCDHFRPDAAPLPLRTRRRFKFLFVGGTIWRKGIDVLLAAYGHAFSDRDDVCLVIKDMGTDSFYRGQTGVEHIARLRQRPGVPEVEYLDRSLTAEELAGLYTACDCLVLPYRGEGFALPVAEAMASGRPVLVTGLGAARDYCNEGNAYLLPARAAYLPQNRVGDLETVGRPWVAEPDLDALVHWMRHVAEHPDEARARGAAARDHVRTRLTWEHAADAVEHRLQALRQQPIHRSPAGSTPRLAAAVEPQPLLLASNSLEQGAAALQHVAQPLVHKRPPRRVGVAVGGDAQAAQVADELLGVAGAELGGVAHGPGLQEAKQVVRRRTVAVDRLHGRAKHLLVMLQPSAAQLGDADRLEAQRRGGADLQLGVDLGGELSGGLAVGADTRPAALAVVVVAEVPDLAPEVALNPADAERDGLLAHDILREPSRHKTPQRTPQTGISEGTSEMQKPMSQ